MAKLKFEQINIGELKTPIEIQRFEHSIDDFGFSTPIWNTIATPRARVDFDDRSVKQIYKDDGTYITSSNIFTIRFIRDITSKDIIVWNGDKYEIYETQDIGDNKRFLTIWARKIEPTS